MSIKNLLLRSAFILIGLSAFAQQTQFGITAGYANIDVNRKSDQANVSTSISGSGFYVGMLTDISVSKDFHVQPEVLYAYAEELHLLLIPILAKVYIAETGMHFLADPQASLILNDNFATFSTNVLGLDFSFGAGYDISQHFL